MKRSEDRILTTHVGSLHRTPALEQWRGKVAADKLNDDPGYLDELHRSVDWVVQQQVDLGIDVVNDGEYSKSLWTGYERERMSGFGTRPRQPRGGSGGARDRAAYDEFYRDADRLGLIWYLEDLGDDVLGPTRSAVCTGEINYTGQQLVGADIENLQSAVKTVNGDVEEAFLAVVAPGSVQPIVPNEYYPDTESYIMAIAEALRVEYRAIVDAGLIVQVDDAFMPFSYDMMAMDKAEYLKYAGLLVDAANFALEGIPEDRIRYHVCWGSWNGPHAFDIPLADIVDLILRINAGAYLIEAANAAHEHEWKVWQDVSLPDGKILIPGVISHATNVIEHPELVAQRIVRFAEIVGKENVIAGTDCGFRTRCHPQIAWGKLRALGDGARLASAQLWR